MEKYELKALTDIWTGDVETNEGKLRLTGIKGSIRWWYEALVRGLGGYACDPTSPGKCELNPRKVKEGIKNCKSLKDILNEQNICAVCRVFGCTGLGAKLILRIEHPPAKREEGEQFINQIKANNQFIVRFVERRSLEPNEKSLMNATIKLIVEYGAIGGKTVLKPSNHNNNSARHHKDYGIIGYVGEEIGKQDLAKITWPQIGKKSDDNEADWPDLKNFWFVKGKHINRLQINDLVSRATTNGKYANDPTAFQIFIGGFTPSDINNACINMINSRKTTTDRDTESKKIFSFHGEGNGATPGTDAKVRRCFGYARRKELDNLISALQGLRNENGEALFNNGDIKKGEDLIAEMTQDKKQ